MTKKDYELFANEIHNELRYIKVHGGSKNDLLSTVSVCKRVFAQDNYAFNPDKFEQACYAGKHIRKSIKG